MTLLNGCEETRAKAMPPSVQLLHFLCMLNALLLAPYASKNTAASALSVSHPDSLSGAWSLDKSVNFSCSDGFIDVDFSSVFFTVDTDKGSNSEI